MDDIHLNDVGTQFVVTVQEDGNVVDISGATTKQMKFKKPDGSIETRTASFQTDGVDGVLTYTTQAGDMNVIGLWELQCYIVVGPQSWHTSTTMFRVSDNLT